MMINKRLIGTVSESKKYIAGNVACQWISLVANIVMMVNITGFFAKLFEKTVETRHFIITLMVAMVTLAVRYICTTWKAIMFSYSGWFAFVIEPAGYVKMFLFVLIGYLFVMILDFARIKKIPMDEALKNIE